MSVIPYSARTDVGQRRDHNEDAHHAQPPVFAVADGVGGSARGEVASRRALETFLEHAQAVVSARSTEDAVRAMEQAVLAANTAVHDAQRLDDTLRGMATTLSAAIVRDGGEVIVGHVGDSRLYVLSAAGARAATEDHSVVAELVRTGRLHAADVPHHPQRNVITRALGPEADVSVDAFVLHVGPGDWLLACSDGLTEHVADAELARIVLEHASDPDGATARLVDLANERGGIDNITVVLAQPVPSDVSGELSVEALRAAETTATLPVEAPVVSDAPAEESGPLPTIAPPGTSPAGPSDEITGILPLGVDQQQIESREIARDRARRRTRGILALVLLFLAAAAIGGFIWSQSYFLVERADGRVGINRGFPIGRLATPHRSSDVSADELSAAERERYVDSHRILDRADAERILDDLATRVEPVGPQETADGIAPGA